MPMLKNESPVKKPVKILNIGNMSYRPAYPGALHTEIKQYPKSPKPSDLKKEWSIYFNYLHGGTWYPIKRKSEINRCKTFKEKEKELHALKAAMEVALKRGWNPVTKSYSGSTEKLVSLDDNVTIVKALDFALKKCDVADSTRNNYRCCLKKIKQAIFELNLQHMIITDVKRKHFRLIIEQAKLKNKWSNKTFNKNLGNLQAMISRLEEWEVIEYNPAHKIKKLPVFETEKLFVPYTEAEKKTISEYLFLNLYGFYVYLMTIYHTGLRPMEVLALKISDLELSKSMIILVPEKSRRNSKTKRLREVQLNRHLLPLLREWIKDVANKECFVFGSPYEPGKGNKGSSIGRTGDGALNPEYFKPSCTRIKRDTVTRLWKKIVIDQLGIKKYQYAAKHTGTDDRLLAGVSIEAMKDMYGHSENYMTERYQTVLKKLRREEINDKSPDFIQKKCPDVETPGLMEIIIDPK
jgi:integrase